MREEAPLVMEGIPVWSPSMADTTEMAGVRTPSPMTEGRGSHQVCTQGVQQARRVDWQQQALRGSKLVRT